MKDEIKKKIEESVLIPSNSNMEQHFVIKLPSSTITAKYEVTVKSLTEEVLFNHTFYGNSKPLPQQSVNSESFLYSHDIRNKLSPFANLLQMLKNGASVENPIFQMEMNQCQVSLEYLKSEHFTFSQNQQDEKESDSFIKFVEDYYGLTYKDFDTALTNKHWSKAGKEYFKQSKTNPPKEK